MPEKLIQYDLEPSHLSSEEQDQLTKISYYYDQLSNAQKIDCLFAILHPGMSNIVETFEDEIIEAFSHQYRRTSRRDSVYANHLWDLLDERDQIKFILHQSYYGVDNLDWMEDHLEPLAVYFKIDKKAHEWFQYNGYPLHRDEFYKRFWGLFGYAIHDKLMVFLSSKGVQYIQELNLKDMFEFYDTYAVKEIY